MVIGIVIKHVEGGIQIRREVRASRAGICRYEEIPDIIEQTQGKLIVDETALQPGDWVVEVMRVQRQRQRPATGLETLREETRSLLPQGFGPQKGTTLTLGDGTICGEGFGVHIAGLDSSRR